MNLKRSITAALLLASALALPTGLFAGPQTQILKDSEFQVVPADQTRTEVDGLGGTQQQAFETEPGSINLQTTAETQDATEAQTTADSGTDTPATDQPDAATPPAAELIVRDLVVLHADHFSELANDPETIGSTLFAPIPHADRRVYSEDDSLMGNRPMPLGLITFEGAFAEPIRVRLDLRYQNAQFHAHWPIYAEKGPYSIDWFKVTEADETIRTDGDETDTHWLSPLRHADDRMWLSVNAGPANERYLLYDASLPFEPSFSLAYDDSTFVLTNDLAAERPAPPLALLIQRDEDAWATHSQTAPWPEASVRFEDAADPANTSGSVSEVLAPLAQLLTDRGYNAEEIEVALGMVESVGMQRSAVSLVYVLPEGVIDDNISLRFRPEPTRVVRTAIVVVTNIDPNLGDQLDELILQLGAEQWVVRDRAMWELINMGQAAIEKVQQVADHEDPEVAFRARAILDAYDMRTRSDR